MDFAQVSEKRYGKRSDAFVPKEEEFEERGNMVTRDNMKWTRL